jgi:starch synthase (maltosyl-transferring)
MTQASPPDLHPNLQSITRGIERGPLPGHRRTYALNLVRSRHDTPVLVASIADLGFDTLLLALPRHRGSADVDMLPPIVDTAAAAGLQVQLDLALHIASEAAAIRQRHPGWYQPGRRFADPREVQLPAGLQQLDPRVDIDAFAAYWAPVLRRWGDRGVSGYRCKAIGMVPPAMWQALVAASPGLRFSAWTPGEAAEAVSRLPQGCFDVTYSSLAWWDFGAAWLRQELMRLLQVAPVSHAVALQGGPVPGPVARRAAERVLGIAAGSGQGLLLPMGFEFGLPSDLTHPEFGADDWQRLRTHAQLDLAAAVRQANRRLSTRAVPAAPAFDILSGEGAAVAVLFEAPGQLTVANRHLDRPANFDPSSILPMLDGRLAGFTDAEGVVLGPMPILLGPGETRHFAGSPCSAIVTALPRDPKRKRDPGTARLAAAAATPRVAIEAITPAVDAGRFAVKRVVGERIAVEADILADGHGKIAAALQWRARDEAAWRETPMRHLGNDRWCGELLPERVGPHLFRILGWPDRFATYRDELTKKHAVGLDVTLELEEGRLLIEAIGEAASGTLDALLVKLGTGNIAERIAMLTDDATAALIARADQRPGQAISEEMPVEADRRAAQFASWYELFPRSQSGDPSRHGTFLDVIRRLPEIQDMGFDVLYFPPIHPIGRINRKGRNNTLTPAQDDPGSPYAIGAAEGGHDAIHPALGTLDDFRALRDAAAAHGLELALDFAIQCSPDHPWLRDHPEWFDWRPDGGLRYAENPPKKYEDIVNVDFYQSGAIPGLWLALRDVVAFWAKEGVRIFRVDNPHTKPFPFWEWLIADIRASYPDALFLSEAFTRPKVMQRLAKLGFSQSYTYFTWRNEKQEIQAYLRELTSSAPGANLIDFFRPNFFVNTPDINPTFLQRSGRAGFLIRAALATTLSGLWGMLQGYEFCEAEPMPGKEEYKDSDKYQIRVRPARAPGDIVEEITRLNAIRRANPALQWHRGLAFHTAANDRVLWYRKANVDRSNVVLIAVSLDPFAPQSAAVEVPLWEWGLGDDAAVIVDDLMQGDTTTWHGKHRTITLDPVTLPFGIWRARPEAAR